MITYRVAHEAGIEVSTFALLAVAIMANVALLILALVLFARGHRLNQVRPTSREPRGCGRWNLGIRHRARAR